MKIGLGNWCKHLFDGARPVAIGSENTFLGAGEEITKKVLAKAQEWVSCHSVVIATIWQPRKDDTELQMNAGSGVIVRLSGKIYGLVARQPG